MNVMDQIDKIGVRIHAEPIKWPVKQIPGTLITLVDRLGVAIEKV